MVNENHDQLLNVSKLLHYPCFESFSGKFLLCCNSHSLRSTPSYLLFVNFSVKTESSFLCYFFYHSEIGFTLSPVAFPSLKAPSVSSTATEAAEVFSFCASFCCHHCAY